jgi:Fe-S-cluster containining protein
MNDYQKDIKKLGKLCKKCGGKCCKDGDYIIISKLELKKLKEKYNFNQGFLKSSYGEINAIKFPKKGWCQFIGKTKGKHVKIRCVLKGKIRPLGCRLYPITFLIEKNKSRFYISRFCPYFNEVLKLNNWIKKSIEDANKELKTWTKKEKLYRSFVHKKIHKNYKYLMSLEK